MKIFQRLLVAPAALGLLAPLAANANDVNLKEISNYSEESIKISTNDFKPLSSKNPLLAGGEGLGQSGNSSADFDGDSFSSTTTASFAADFVAGSVDGVAGEDQLGVIYGYQMDLATSFTGNDSLDVSLQGGNGDATLTELDINQAGSADAIGVDSISYTLGLGDKTSVFFGNGADAGTVFNIACVYGGPTDTLDDCGNAFSQLGFSKGTVVGGSYDHGNGLSVAVAYTGEGNKAAGLATKEGNDAFGVNLAYNADSYGVSVAFADIESPVEDGTYGIADASTNVVSNQSFGINAYYQPDVINFPSISVGLESTTNQIQELDTLGGTTKGNDTDSTHWFIGLQWEDVGSGTLGAAIGTKEHTLDNDLFEEETMYEAFYSYPINDGMTITPIVYVKENSEKTVDDETGFLTKLSFSF